MTRGLPRPLTLEEMSKPHAFEWACDYKPFEDDLPNNQYAEYGYQKGFEFIVKNIKMMQLNNTQGVDVRVGMTIDNQIIIGLRQTSNNTMEAALIPRM